MGLFFILFQKITISMIWMKNIAIPISPSTENGSKIKTASQNSTQMTFNMLFIGR
jgi:hypothetical protein